MSRARTKSQRLNDIQFLLWQNQTGLSKAEIAERLGVDRSTIQRDMDELEAEGIPVMPVGDWKFTLDPSYSLLSLRLNPAESVALYLAARRLARQSSKAIKPVLSAVEKLSSVLRQPMLQHLRDATDRAWELPPDTDRSWSALIASGHC